MTDAQRSPASHPARRIVALLVVVVLCVAAIPYVLTVIYIAANPVSTLMLWRWATGARVERTWVPIDAISGALPLAVIVAEDGQFCRHRGLDLKALREAIEEADDVSEARGGSTITQQTAKNLFLWSGRSLVRKALEAPLALWIDLVMPKRRIMEIYLNIAEWGPGGQFGAEAGAQWAFRKSVRELSPREAATLASILPNPKRRSAKAPGTGVRRLAGIYVARAARSPRLAACVRGRPAT
jgi:monofunctional biosynthetic peptidoglycan transglycosylase